MQKVDNRFVYVGENELWTEARGTKHNIELSNTTTVLLRSTIVDRSHQ